MMVYILISVACAILALLMGLTCFRSRREYVAVRDELDRLSEEKNIVIDFLHRIAEDIGNGATREEMYSIIVRATALSCGAMSACVYEKLPDGRLKSAAMEGLFPPQTKKIPRQRQDETRSNFLDNAAGEEIIEPNEGLLGEVVRDCRGVLIKDASHDPRVINHNDDALRVRSIIAVPMSFRGEIFGALAMANPISGKSFTETDFSLATSLGEQAGLALHNLEAVKDLILKNKMEFDLRLASSVQRYLLPSQFPKTDKLDFAVKYFPQQLIGGDFYDFFDLPDGKFGLVIGDVSGKGVSAAILMALCQTKLRHMAMSGKSPADTLKILNAEMISAMRADMFITMIYAVVDADASLITLARAGHEAPLIYRAATPDEPAEKIRAQGMAVGMVEPELFDSSITDVSVPFGRGDILVLYTDGVTEAVNNGGEEFGAARLARTVATLGSRSAEDLNDELITALERFTHASANYTDDLTLLSVKKL